MKRLCYGTYAKVLSICSINNPTQELLHTDLIKPIDDLLLVKEIPSQASRLFNCEINMNKHLVDDIRCAEILAIRENMANFIKEHINQNMLEAAVAAIWAIIKEDDNIRSYSVVERYEGLTKDSLNQSLVINAVDFLAGTFFCAAVDAKNREGSFCIEFIDEDFIKNAAERFNKSGSKITRDETKQKPFVSGIKNPLSHIADYPLFVAAPLLFSPITTKINKHKSIYRCGYDDRSTLILTGQHNDGKFVVVSSESIFINWKLSPTVDVPNNVTDMLYTLLCGLGGDFNKKKIGICSGHDEYVTAERFNNILKLRFIDRNVKVENCSLGSIHTCDVLVLGCPQLLEENEIEEILAFLFDGGSILLCGNGFFWTQQKDENVNNKKIEDFPLNKIGKFLGFKIEATLSGKQVEVYHSASGKKHLQFTPLQLIGEDVFQSEDEKATALFRDAFAGNSGKQNQLGKIYESGNKFDYALYWYKVAAFLGNDNAQYNLALCYTDTFHEGIYLNNMLCVAWLESAAINGRNMLAFGYLGYAKYYGKLGLEINKKLGFEELKRSASKCGSKMQYELGIIYLSQKMYKEAGECFREVCYGQGTKRIKAEAQYQLALLLKDGKGYTKDLYKAQQYLTLSAKNGHNEAAKTCELLENELRRAPLLEMLCGEDEPLAFNAEIFEGTKYSTLTDDIKEKFLRWLQYEVETRVGGKIGDYLSEEKLAVFDKIVDGDIEVINKEIERLRINDSMRYQQLKELCPHMDDFSLQKEVLDMEWLSYNLPEYDMIMKVEIAKLKHELVRGEIDVTKLAPIQ